MNFLLLTSDATLLKVIQSSFSAAAVRLQLRTDAASAIELAGRRRLDGFIIDCDDVSGGLDVLAKMRKGDPSWEKMVPDAVAKLIKERRLFGIQDKSPLIEPMPAGRA